VIPKLGEATRVGPHATKTQLVAARHPGVSALGMQRLLDAFRDYKGDVENLMPAAVDSQDSYDRFVTIMRRINQYLFPAFTPDTIIPLHALIVVQWLKGFSLSRMIERNIDYHRRTGRSFKLPVLIRSTMELVEQIAGLHSLVLRPVSRLELGLASSVRGV
jgi:hypothetical protein